jgi:hypothetical protein
MGFNKRKMEAWRAETAEKEAAARRATEAQILEDAGRLVAAWNARQAKRMPMLFSPTIGCVRCSPRDILAAAAPRLYVPPKLIVAAGGHHQRFRLFEQCTVVSVRHELRKRFLSLARALVLYPRQFAEHTTESRGNNYVFPHDALYDAAYFLSPHDGFTDLAGHGLSGPNKRDH